MKVAYITAHTPYGHGEIFVLDEMLMMAEIGVDLVIVPRNPPEEVFHNEARKLLDRTIWLPLFNWPIFFRLLRALFFDPRLWTILWKIIRSSRTLKILLKNLVVIPKAVYVASLLKQQGVEHIHAHWGSTTATMAWVISELTGIPWSFTLHRWDIAENNLLKLKAERASFVRCISQDGRNEALQIIGAKYSDKVKLVHMGVRVPKQLPLESTKTQGESVIVCPANFVPKKGHRFLIEACKLLVDKGISQFRCLFVGDGPLEEEIREQISRYGLGKMIQLTGRLPHDTLMKMYESGAVDAVILPSIVTDDGEKEGIPVALMEAMAYGIPVISTTTGGVPELLHDGAGILVPPGSAEALARAIQELMEDEGTRKNLKQRGRGRVRDEFDLQVNTLKLLSLMKGCGTE